MRPFRKGSALPSRPRDRRLGPGGKFRRGVHLVMRKGCRNLGDKLEFIRAAVQRYMDATKPAGCFNGLGRVRQGSRP
jgi:hypothetical protein